VVEPANAASIICLGLENFRRHTNVRGRFLMAFGFGLVHGFGFVGALRETGPAVGGAAIVMLLFWLRRMSRFARYGTPVFSS
jgi:amino acid permease